MDLNDYPMSYPASQYEITVLKKQTNDLIHQVKHEAFNYMDQLEGWCSKNKASVLINLIFMLNPKTIVEIGVWGGKSLIPMAHALKTNERGVAYGIDPWDNLESVDGMEGVNYEWWNSIDHKKILSDLEIKIIQFDLESQIILLKTTSQLAPIIPNIDILHIDGNHSEKSSTLDVNKWVPLVRKGGIIIFDDVTWGTNDNAVQWLDENCIRLAEFHEDNDWAVWIKP